MAPVKKSSVKTVSKKVTKPKAITAKTVTKQTGLTVDVLDITGKKKSTIELPKELFDAPMNETLVAQAVRVYLINKRQGGAKTLTRGEVQGSRRKIYRQKGTGRARHSDRYAPTFVGGGRAHGPKPRPFEKTLTKKMRKQALSSVLSSHFKNSQIVVVDGLETLEGKTKLLVRALTLIAGNVKHGKVLEKTIVATPKKIDNVYQAGRNIKNVTIRDARLLHTYEVLNSKRIIFTKDAISSLQESLSS